MQAPTLEMPLRLIVVNTQPGLIGHGSVGTIPWRLDGRAGWFRRIRFAAAQKWPTVHCWAAPARPRRAFGIFGVPGLAAIVWPRR